MIRVTVWNEYIHELREPYAGPLYPGGIHETLARLPADADFEITVN